jgi:predicted DNA-binding transcriptional regulator AlpA
MSRLVSDVVLAAALGIGRSSLWRAVQNGAVPAPVYIAGRSPRWPLEETIQEVLRRAAERQPPLPKRARARTAAATATK